MTVTNAIPVSLSLVRDTYQAALDTLVAQRVYWLLAPEEAQLPCIVLHSQDAGGAGVPRIGSVDWSGLMAVRAFASTRQAAESIATNIIAAIPQTILVAPYTITSRLVRPIPIPPANMTHVAGWLYQVTVAQ